MEALIQEYYDAQQRVKDIYDQICNTEDGFVYITRLRCFGSVYREIHKNSFTVQELCDEYCGDNGIVDVYTNNPNHGIDTYGSVEIISLEELQEMNER
jgi:hypothetical protein